MNYQCQPRLAALVTSFTGGTAFEWSGFGVQSVVRTGAGVYAVTWQQPRHFSECTYMASAIGDGTVKVTVEPSADGYSGVIVRLVDDNVVPVAVDTGFTLSMEPLPPRGGTFGSTFVGPIP